jgi:hypothetical protein
MVVAAIPWEKIIKYGPVLVDLADRLLDTIKKNIPRLSGGANQKEPSLADLAKRLTSLENNEIQQAELVSQIAGQLESLTKALQVMHARILITMYIAVGSFVFSAFALLMRLM